ncbi:SbcC family exonuclease [Lacticaseibacillus baoqingensis]|uniref:SbcC family exonuclease n=1 Tax=Lacticaseibacillus baoqingensis TaxID=2486013 RepID=A0ABW4EA10_9LACO|nr:SbcC family exonuclease [Lacticaseibacillus baoqingensis]
MTVESSLNYQQTFFNEFSDAWAKQSTYHLYKGIDQTAETLRLEVSETPGYILAYDKGAQDELQAFLQRSFITFLRQHIPFFEVADDGRVFFGDWYHRREFGSLSVFDRSIDQLTPEQRNILPQLEAFAQDPDHYLDNQIEALRKDVYRSVNDLHNQLEAATVEAPSAPSRSTTAPGNSFRGLLKNFIDPDDDDTSASEPTPQPRRRSAPADLKARFDAAKAQADSEFDAKKRTLQVSAAITRYEYQAVIGTYSSVTQFENVLASLKDDFMRALEVKGDQANA